MEAVSDSVGEGARGSALAAGPFQSEPDQVYVPETRPGFGMEGSATQLCVNYFKASLTRADDVYHYNVSIEPDVVSKELSRAIFKKVRVTYNVAECRGENGAYDGEKSLFTRKMLDLNLNDLPVSLNDRIGLTFRTVALKERPRDVPTKQRSSEENPGEEVVLERRTAFRGRKFVVKIKFAAKIRMQAIEDMMRGAMGLGSREQEGQTLEALRVLNIVLSESALRSGFLSVRNNFFQKDFDAVCNLGEGIEAWRGYHSNVKPTGFGLMLNLDTTMTTILKAVTVDEFLKERFNGRDLNGLQVRDLVIAKSILKNVWVEATHMLGMSRRRKIFGFSDRPIRELMFTKDMKGHYGIVEEEEVSVAQYYAVVYSHEVKYPRLPALDVGNKKEPNFMPLELCKIVEGQPYVKSLSREQRQALIAAGNHSPQDWRRICENVMKASMFSSDKLIRKFGLKVDDKLVTVTGRILPAPKLEFGEDRAEVPQDGRWNFNGKTVKERAVIKLWAVAVFDERCNDAESIAQRLAEICLERGVMLNREFRVMSEPNNMMSCSPEQRVKRMFIPLTEGIYVKPEFILVILPNKKSPIYVPLKRYCEVEMGIVSQCMVKPQRLNNQYLANLALKINLKMGGVNSSLSLSLRMPHTPLAKSTIIFGMGVSHGSPGDVNVPSIAAVLATKDWPEVSLYSCQVRTQPAKTEMIEGLYVPGGGMVTDCLLAYYKTRKSRTDCADHLALPRQIIVYRNGVSNSQFQECLKSEFTAFKLACEELKKFFFRDFNPEITFIVAQKRHNTRFFRQGEDKMPHNGNVLPGTVVDEVVCHPHHYDFFLVSQPGLVGTSRPTHYHILVNEIKDLKPDVIQGFTNDLCYTFGRSTTAISIAAPAAYARVAAARYRKYLVDTRTESSGGTATSSLGRSSDEGDSPRPVQSLPALKIRSKRSMFFC